MNTEANGEKVPKPGESGFPILDPVGQIEPGSPGGPAFPRSMHDPEEADNLATTQAAAPKGDPKLDAS